MKNILQFSIVWIGLVAQIVAGAPTNVTTDDPWHAAETKLLQLLPELEALAEKYANDTEIQLGLASLHSIARMPPKISLEEQIEKVLRTDPGNRAAWAIKARLLCTQYTAMRNSLIDELSGMIEIAKAADPQELLILSYSRLYPWLKEDDDGTLTIKDFNRAVTVLRNKLDGELPPILAVLNKAEQQDPENALYNYLKAHLHFDLGEENPAVAQIQKATTKRHLNNYFTERRRAVQRVLRQVGFPEDQRPFIEDRHSPFADFIAREIWRQGLSPLAEAYEAQEAFQSAGQIYELSLHIAKQIRQEPLPYPSHFNQTFSQRLEKWANQRKQELSTKLRSQQEKLPEPNVAD